MSIEVTIEDVVARIKLSVERSLRDLIDFPYDSGNIRRFLESAETTLIMVAEAKRKCLDEYREGLDDGVNGRPSTYVDMPRYCLGYLDGLAREST